MSSTFILDTTHPHRSWRSSPSVRAFAFVVSALSLGVKASIFGLVFLMIFASAFNYIILYLHVGGSFAFLSLSFINIILDLSRIEWVLSWGAWLCSSGVHTFLMGAMFCVNRFTAQSARSAQWRPLLFECRSMQGLPCSVTTCLYNATVLE